MFLDYIAALPRYRNPGADRRWYYQYMMQLFKLFLNQMGNTYGKRLLTNEIIMRFWQEEPNITWDRRYARIRCRFSVASAECRTASFAQSWHFNSSGNRMKNPRRIGSFLWSQLQLLSPERLNFPKSKASPGGKKAHQLISGKGFDIYVGKRCKVRRIH